MIGLKKLLWLLDYLPSIKLPYNMPSASLEQILIQPFETLAPTHAYYATRQQAAQAFQQQGIPTSKNEAYKYTPIAQAFATPLINDEQSLASPMSSAKPTLHDLEAEHIILQDGQLTTSPSLANEVQLLTLKAAYHQQHPAFLAHFAQHAQSQADSLIALNTALFAEEGLFIYVPDHVVLDKPLIIYHCTTHSTSQPISYPRLLLVVGKNSHATVITSWQGTGFTNAVAEVVVEENARLDYYTLQTQLAPAAHLLHTTQCYQARQSTLNTYTFTWSGKLVRNNLYSMIDASHSETNLYGLYCLQDEQHVDNFTTVDHRQPYTHSHELYKGIIMGAATGVFNGRIYVRPAAQKTNAFQENNNLVLSEDATLHTKPQLEIWADDVKCSHGATTGQLDAEQLFYLRTRGIPQDAARSLLRRAFVSEVIDKVPLTALRAELQTSWAAQERES